MMRKIISGLCLILALGLANPALARGLGASAKKNNSSHSSASQYSFGAIPRSKNQIYLPTPPPANISSSAPYLKCFTEACKIRYQTDLPIGADIWQTPEMTKKRKGGDCEDISFYLYDLLKKSNIESRVVFGYMNGDYQNGHSWVELEDKNKNIIILDGATRKIFLKSSFPKDPYYDYVEYHSEEGYQRDINQFIKDYEKGIEKEFVNKRR